VETLVVAAQLIEGADIDRRCQAALHLGHDDRDLGFQALSPIFLEIL
jgi:hypothetical protein